MKQLSTYFTFALIGLSVILILRIWKIEENPQLIRVPEPFKEQYWNYTDSMGVRKHTSVFCEIEGSHFKMIIHGITDTFRCQLVNFQEGKPLEFKSEDYNVTVHAKHLTISNNKTLDKFTYNR